MIVAVVDDAERSACVDDLRDAGFIVTAHTADGADAVRLAAHYQPELLLLGTGVSDLMAVIRRAREVDPGIGVIVLTGPGDPEVARGALLAGARGVVAQEIEPAGLHAVMRAVLAGVGAVAPELLHAFVPAPGHGFRPIHGPLSNREWEIIDLLIAGRTLREIAAALVLTEDTMRSHLKHMRQKLGVQSRDELVPAAKRLFDSRPPFSPRPS